LTRSPVESFRSAPESEVEFLSREQRHLEAALRAVSHQFLPDLPAPLRPAAEYALSSTGKRLRPILCLLAYRAATGKTQVPEAAYRLSCSVEIVHTYSLIHDDLPCMDDDDMRRGRPTTHRVFGDRLAIVAGAALLPMAIEVLDANAKQLGLSEVERSALILELTTAAGAEGMVGGQLIDLESEQQEIDGSRLELIHRLKTGALLTASLRIGALAGRASSEVLTALTAYGSALGLAFQIADDLLDVEGLSSDLGKTAGRDVALRKAAYPALYGVDGARALARSRCEEAKSALVGLNLPELTFIADYVVERRK
jgi:geranylgeranyl diphosphate synthase, type II